jgi:hypothetical protein
MSFPFVTGKWARRALAALAVVGLTAWVLQVRANDPVVAQADQESIAKPVTERASIQVERATVLTRAELRTRVLRDARGLSKNPPAREKPERWTIDENQLRALKQAAASARATSRGQMPESSPAGEPTTVHADFEGVGQVEACGTCRPPDTHGAVGLTQFVEITNSNLNVYEKGGAHNELLSVRLNTFLGYQAQFAFDPRIVYDRTWNRWVISAEAFPESATVQVQFLAISQTHDATGNWFIYHIDVNIFNNDDFWDFPQLGMDQDAIIVNANVFGPTTFRGARMFAVAKARLYNGLGWFVPLWTNLQGTLAPPIVLDQSARTHLLAAPPSGTTVFHYTLRDSAHAFDQTMTLANITVPFYSAPADAPQPGTAARLDTLDARFQNAGTQVGDRLFQVHTVAVGSFATPQFYEFDTAANAITQSGQFFASIVSQDFNPSIAANDAGDVYVTWTVTEPGTRLGGGIFPQVRFGGRRDTDPPGVIGPGTALFTSPTFYNLGRWGDYSAVTVDPQNPDRAWIVNETVTNPTTWSTRIGAIGF